MDESFNYKKYRWFFTKSGKLVYGGKSAEQNEEVVNSLKGNYVVMHTKIPGSPFAIIFSPIDKVNESDLEETAIWTACFSRAWRTGLKKTTIDIFTTEQIAKKKGMSKGTYGVMGKIDRKTVELKLVLTFQKGVLRAVPEVSAKERKLMVLTPGKITKEKTAEEISKMLKKGKEEVLNALPTGGFKEVN
jgi:hypothetical protein